MLQEFKQFALKGNAIDMAVGIIIGAAFNNLVSSLVEDVIMPPIGMLLGHADFSSLAITLQNQTATQAAVTLKYGQFLNAVIDFFILAFVVFLLVTQMNRLRRNKKDGGNKPQLKECPLCCSPIPVKAKRCPLCTADIAALEKT